LGISEITNTPDAGSNDRTIPSHRRGVFNDCVHKQEIYDYHKTAVVYDTFTEGWSDELNLTSRGFKGLGREERLEFSTFRPGVGIQWGTSIDWRSEPTLLARRMGFSSVSGEGMKIEAALVLCWMKNL